MATDRKSLFAFLSIFGARALFTDFANDISDKDASAKTRLGCLTSSCRLCVGADRKRRVSLLVQCAPRNGPSVHRCFDALPTQCKRTIGVEPPS